MQTQSKAAAAADLAHFFDSPLNYAHASDLAALVLENYGNGYAWFRPCTDRAESEDALYWPTQAGHDLCARWRAERACFGREIS